EKRYVCLQSAKKSARSLLSPPLGFTARLLGGTLLGERGRLRSPEKQERRKGNAHVALGTVWQHVERDEPSATRDESVVFFVCRKRRLAKFGWGLSGSQHLAGRRDCLCRGGVAGHGAK